MLKVKHLAVGLVSALVAATGSYIFCDIVAAEHATKTVCRAVALTDGRTAIVTASRKSPLEFQITATSPDGTRSAVTFAISAPEPADQADDYICSYRVDPLGLTGTVLAGDPFQAVRWALFEMRIELVHRFAGWTFLYPDGRSILFDYEETA